MKYTDTEITKDYEHSLKELDIVIAVLAVSTVFLAAICFIFKLPQKFDILWLFTFSGGVFAFEMKMTYKYCYRKYFLKRKGYGKKHKHREDK